MDLIGSFLSCLHKVVHLQRLRKGLGFLCYVGIRQILIDALEELYVIQGGWGQVLG